MTMIKNAITIALYSQEWLRIFSEESQRISLVLQKNCAAIHHIGSTSIPHMPAKPIIDILIELDNMDSMDEVKIQLSTLGYINIHRQIIPHRSYFTSRSETEGIHFNLHIYERGDPQVRRHINFREYLIHHRSDAQAYAALKKELAVAFHDNVYQYVLGKDKFVQSIDIKAKIWAEKKCSIEFLAAIAGKCVNLHLEGNLLQRIESNFNITKTFYAQYIDNVILIRKPGYTLVNSNIHDANFNCVIDADFPKAKSDHFIHEVNKHFALTQTPFFWWVSPSEQTKSLRQDLERNNYIKCENRKIIYLNVDHYLPPLFEEDYQIIRVLDELTFKDFKFLLSQNKLGYDAYFASLYNVLSVHDPIEYYVCYKNGKAIGVSQVCYYAGVVNIQILHPKASAELKSFNLAIYDFHIQQIKLKQYQFAYTYLDYSDESLCKKTGWNVIAHFEVYQNNTACKLIN